MLYAQVKVQIGRFFDFILQYIFVQVVKSSSWAKGSLMIEFHEIIVIMCEYYSILYIFRIEPSPAVQGAYDVCSKYMQFGMI